MKIIDKYLIRQFLQTVFFSLLAFILIFLVIDAMENLDDFIDQNVPWINILHYYVVFTPEIIKLKLLLLFFLVQCSLPVRYQR